MTEEAPKKLAFWRTTTAAAVVFFLLAAGSLVALAATWAQGYDDRIGPRTRIGNVDVSARTPDEAREMVQVATDQLLANGFTADLNGRRADIPLITLSGDTTEDVSFDVDAAVQAALADGRSPQPVLDVILLLKNRFLGPDRTVRVPVELNRANLEANIREAFPDLETPVVEGAFRLTRGRNGWSGTVTESKVGRLFDFAAFWPRLDDNLGALKEGEPVRLTMTSVRPEVEGESASLVMSDAIAALEAAPYQLAERPDGSGRTWSLSDTALSKMLKAGSEDGRIVLAVDETAFDTFLDSTAQALETPARNARFQIVDGKVAEFATSAPGVGLDRAETRARLTAMLGHEEAIVHVAVVQTQPDVTTEQVNDLGIIEELGVGTSSYRGSPRNRIKNIRNGVNLLNGVLIAPDEEFSLINALRPFTLGNGYLPELVIKGDKIEPELGGGLCQIGTTTFRAIMNSGFPVTERRNHSLVVSYYNDPANGNPGTDATIYEPAPDLKFKNDTGHYVLLTTEMNETAQSLSFHFWGTSDGRKGSYSPPQVLRWIPYGEDRRVETEDLPAGTEQCQAPHIGADATFTYTIERADGTREDTVYDSHYRPLPRLCLIGKAVDAPPLPEGTLGDGAVSEPVTPTE